MELSKLEEKAHMHLCWGIPMTHSTCIIYRNQLYIAEKAKAGRESQQLMM